jgi:hypothetical protein
MRSFEAILRVPPDHRLEQVRTRARDDAVKQIHWEHQEYDVNGRMVARYHSFLELHENGEQCCGWRKYDSSGHMIDAGDLTAPKDGIWLDEA